MSVTFFGSAVNAPIGAWLGFTVVLCFTGTAMGVVGVGGVVIVPAAIAILRVDTKLAIASTVPGYMLTSAAGVWSYRSLLFPVHSKFASVVAVGAIGGGFAAAVAMQYLNTGPLAIAIACFAAFFGLKSLVQLVSTLSGTEVEEQRHKLGNEATAKQDSDEDGTTLTCELCSHPPDQDDTGRNAVLGPAPMVSSFVSKDGAVAGVLGTFVGFLSALSATSGPLIFIPSALLLYPSLDSPAAVGLALLVGLPMSVAMTVGNLVVGYPYP